MTKLFHFQRIFKNGGGGEEGGETPSGSATANILYTQKREQTTIVVNSGEKS